MSKISVILPVYNGEDFIAEAVESVLKQTWSTWELIVVNDGSTDNTQAILEGFDDHRIKILTQENRGESAARNVGLELAEGSYIALLDADDMYYENAFADCLQFFKRNKHVDVIYADGHVFRDRDGSFYRMRDLRPGFYTGNILDRLVLDNCILFPVSTMIRRSLIEENGIRFDPNLGYGVDWDFWIQLASYGYFDYLDRLICSYRIHFSNLTVTIEPQNQRNELAKVMMKSLVSSWFHGLPVQAKIEFFRRLCLVLLANSPEGQTEVIQSNEFCRLPIDSRAQILRWIASSHIAKGRNHEFATDCLKRALYLQPQDRNSRVLMWLTLLGPSVSMRALGTWQCLRKAHRDFLTGGKARSVTLESLMAGQSSVENS